MNHDVDALGQPIGYPVPDWTPPPAPCATELLGRFCRLERLDPARHAESLYEANRLDTNNKMWTYLPYGPFHTVEEYQAYLAGPLIGNLGALMYAVVPVTTGRPVGLAGCHSIDPAWGSLEIGNLMFSPLLQGTTAATEAIFLLIDMTFALGYRRCQWRADVHNGPSCAAAQRFGFSFEGIFRQQRVIKGRNRDTAWYSILDHEWPALRTVFQQWLAPQNFDANGKQRIRLSDLTQPLLHNAVKIPR